jgi:hypothetical protein
MTLRPFASFSGSGSVSQLPQVSQPLPQLGTHVTFFWQT